MGTNSLARRWKVSATSLNLGMSLARPITSKLFSLRSTNKRTSAWAVKHESVYKIWRHTATKTSLAQIENITWLLHHTGLLLVVCNQDFYWELCFFLYRYWYSNVWINNRKKSVRFFNMIRKYIGPMCESFETLVNLWAWTYAATLLCLILRQQSTALAPYDVNNWTIQKYAIWIQANGPTVPMAHNNLRLTPN